MAGLNENHKRRILSTLQYSDKLLSDSLNMLSPASRSPFPRYVEDISPSQRHWVEDYVSKIREQMGRLLERFRIETKPPDTLTSWALRTSLTTLDIALEDTYPDQMRGYGEMDASAAADLSWTLQEIRRLVSQLQAFLVEAREIDATPQTREIPATGFEVLLRSLRQVIARHGLIEFLPALNSIVHKLESHRYEIAVFGRVSSGKSSLINRLLEIDLLPVGTTPITAVPIQIVAGSEPQLHVFFADRRQDLPVQRLAEFATEQGNPANARRVVGIEVAVPSRRLRTGVAFVDTPGIASLATTGTELSYAYLPNSDMGLVLVDGHSALAREDLDLLRALHVAGIPATVMISKCDLLSSADVERVAAYTRDAIAEHLGSTPEVTPISSVEEWVPAVNRWFESSISPLLQEAREALEASLRRKVESLRSTLLASLQMKASRTADQYGGAPDIETLVRPLDERVLEFKESWERKLDDLSSLEQEVLQAASSEMGSTDDSSLIQESLTSAPLKEALIRSVASFSRPMLEEYHEIARPMKNLIRELNAKGGSSEEVETIEIPQPAGLPLPITDPLDQIVISRPGPLARISRAARIRHFQRELEDKAGAGIQEILSELRPRLRHWFRTTVFALEEAYRAHTDPLRYRSPKGDSGNSKRQDDLLRADIELLREQGSPVVPAEMCAVPAAKESPAQ